MENSNMISEQLCTDSPVSPPPPVQSAGFEEISSVDDSALNTTATIKVSRDPEDPDAGVGLEITPSTGDQHKRII